MSYLVVLTFKVVNTLSSHYNDQHSDQLPNLQVQKWLILCWRWFLESGRECVASCFAYEGSLFVIDKFL
jgi:hypothetical protein